MTFLDMQNAFCSDQGYNQPSTEQIARAKRWINEGYRHLMVGRERLRQVTLGLTTENNRALYPVAQAVARINYITQVSNSQRLTMLTLDKYRLINPGLNQSSGFAYQWVPYGWSGVLRQPEGKGLWIVSTAIGDTTQVATVTGFITNGDQVAPTTATLNGTTRVQVGTRTDWYTVEKLSFATAGTGIISVYDAAVGGNEILRLQVGQTSAQYEHILMFPTPSAVVDYVVDADLKLVDLVSDNDIPLLPEDFHDMLPLYARGRDYKRAGDRVRIQEFKEEWKNRYTTLQMNVDFPQDWQPISGGALSGYGWNNLGPWYPADIRY